MIRSNHKIYSNCLASNSLFRPIRIAAVLVLLFSLYSCGGDTNGNAKDAGKRLNIDASKFLQFYIKHYIKEDSVKLMEKPAQMNYRCSVDLPKQINGLNIIWFKDVKDRGNWVSSEVSGVNIISAPQNNAAVSMMPFYVFARPIFSEDGNYVAFYFEFYCGDRCGKGGVKIFQRKANRWEEIQTYCEWVS